MSPNAKRLSTEIAATLKNLDITVSNVLIGRFGINLDAATEQDAKRAADMLNAQGARVHSAEIDGEWMVSGHLS